MKKWILRVLVIVCALFILSPHPAFASETPMSGTCGKEGSSLTWRMEPEGGSYTLIISGMGEMEDYEYAPWPQSKEIEKVIVEDGVTSMGKCAFDGCTGLRSVELPNTLESIGVCAFSGCEKLEGAKIPDSVITIGQSAFSGCRGLGSIVIPNGVTAIERYTFNSCEGLTNVTIPGSVTRIGSWAFGSCAFSSIVIPNGVTCIEDSAFRYSHLKNVFLPKSVTEVWNDAFLSVTDIYYEGSSADWMSSENLANRTKGDKYDLSGYYTSTAAIHFNSAPDDLPEYKVWCNGGYETFDCPVEDCVKKSTSGSYSYVGYNPQLAHMLIAMCNSVYNENDMRTTFQSFGFNDPQYESGTFLTYGLAEKRLENGEAWVLVVIRGTDGFISWENASNIFDSGINSAGEHSGFSDAANELYKDMMTYLETKHIELDSENTHFVITGFSRGAAVTNLLASRLAKQSWTWAYAFACPDIGTSFSLNTLRVFNIGSANDFVSWVPGGALDGFSDWGKHGASYWYSDDWDDWMNLKMGMDAHNQVKYLEYLRAENPPGSYKTCREAKAALDDAVEKRTKKTWNDIMKRMNVLQYIGIHCPVDVEVYASDGSLVGRITRGYVSDVDEEKIYAFVTGDEKNMYILDSDTYTFKLTATDEGTMDYIVQKIRTSDNSVLESKTFANVKLADGKQMAGTVKCDSEVSGTADATLHTLDDAGNLQNEVMADGHGTEKPVSGIPESPGAPSPDGSTGGTGQENTNPGGNACGNETLEHGDSPPGNKKPSVKVKKIKISGLSHKIAVGKKITLKSSVSPSNAQNKALKWKSSNRKYATVSSKGVVSIKKAGGGKTVTITAKAMDGSGKKASYKIKCMKGVVKKITISGQKKRILKTGKSISLKAKVKASGGANKAVQWKSSNPKYAVVNKNGKVSAKKAGKGKTVTITAKATDGSGKKASVKIRIK